MNISEIFFSVQGEGKWVGIPSIFIRTSSCNLRCQWCDTPYTSWNPEKNIMTVEEIIEEIKRYSALHVVITGGEPFLQKDLPKLVSLLKEMKKIITIETNGTIFKPVLADLLSISPKLKNSTPRGNWKIIHEEKRISVSTLNAMVRNQENAGLDFQFKFVVQDPEDIKEIEKIINQIEFDISREKIFLMPQAKTREELRIGYEMVVDLCKKTGFRLGTRTHVEIWGDRRNV